MSGGTTGPSLDAAKIAELNAADLIIVSRTTTGGAYGDTPAETTQWNGLMTPLISLNSNHILGGSTSPRWGWMGYTFSSYVVASVMEVLDRSHPIFAGVTIDDSNQVVAVNTKVGTGKTTFIAGLDTGNGRLLARTAAAACAWIAEWQPGVEFYPGCSQIPAGKRLLFSAGTTEDAAAFKPRGAFNLTDEGQKMFLNAVAYMIGDLNQASHSPVQGVVPNVVGMTQSAAQSAITAAGLGVGTVTQASSTTVAKGNVVSQDPAAGISVVLGTATSLVVSSGPSGTSGAAGHIIWVAENIDFNYDSLPDDYEWIPWLEAVGYTVDVRRDYWTSLDAAKVAELNAADLIIVSRTTSIGNYANAPGEAAQWNAVMTPLITLNSNHTLGGGEAGPQWCWMSYMFSSHIVGPLMEVLDPAHPIFTGVTLDADRRVAVVDPTVGSGKTMLIAGTNVGNGKLLAKTAMASCAWSPNGRLGPSSTPAPARLLPANACCSPRAARKIPPSSSLAVPSTSPPRARRCSSTRSLT